MTMGHRDIARIVGYVPQTIFPSFDYNVIDYVVTGLAPWLGIFEKPKEEHYRLAEDSLRKMGIEYLKNKPYSKISSGELQQVSIARVITQKVKIVLMDEPSMGLAPLLIKEIFEIIQRLNKEEKIPILLVEQNVKLALTVAPYAYVMENGRIVMDDTSEKLKENPDIRDFYLGLTDVGGRKSFREVKHYKRRKRWLS